MNKMKKMLRVLTLATAVMAPSIAAHAGVFLCELQAIVVVCDSGGCTAFGIYSCSQIA